MMWQLMIAHYDRRVKKGALLSGTRTTLGPLPKPAHVLALGSRHNEDDVAEVVRKWLTLPPDT